MRIVVLCATRRGLLFLERLAELTPESDFTVFSFREEPSEPPFFDDIRRRTESISGRFIEARQVTGPTAGDYWESTENDLLFAVSWRYMVPETVYRRVRLGAFVFHDSLLPTYRGFSPTVWAIANGDEQTGVTLFEMAEEVDSGDIIDQAAIPIGPDDTITTVIEQVTIKYLTLLDRNLPNLISGTAPRRRQDESLASYTCKRLPQDNRVDWNQSTQSVFNLIRAVTHPYSGAYTTFEEKVLRIWEAERVASSQRYVGRVPGRIVKVDKDRGVIVLTGNGSLRLKAVQLGDGPVIAAAELLKYTGISLGQ